MSEKNEFLNGVIMNKIKNILLIINYAKKISGEYICSLYEILSENGRTVSVFADSFSEFQKLCPSLQPSVISQGSKLSDIDIAVVLGGDGSIIRAARQISAYDIPILGINFGHIGYLAELEESDTEMLSHILDGDFTVEERMMLTARIKRTDGSITYTPPALNDIVLSNGPIAKLLSFDICCDGIVIQHCRADGLVIATPTGSTAYSMSAGGPILSPVLDAFCLTPICPHSLGNRPVILPGSSTVSISGIGTVDENSVYITVDGNKAEKLSPGDEISVERAGTKAKIIRLQKNSFLSILKSKL